MALRQTALLFKTGVEVRNTGDAGRWVLCVKRALARMFSVA